jgi:hypothetical protein
MQPISVKREAQFRGPSSSEDFNLSVDENYFDLVQLYNIAAEYGVAIPENMQMLVLENIMLQKRINELQDTLENIQATTPMDKKLLHSFSSDGNLGVAEDYLQLEHDADYGILKIPHVQEVSKLYLVSLDNENFVPEALKYKIYESTASIDISVPTILLSYLEDTKMKKMLDGNKNTFWLRKLVQSPSVDETYFCLELELPVNIINHTRANIITIDPTPLSSLTLLDIRYKTISEWQRLPSYPMEEVGGQMVPTSIDELGRIKFCFPTRDVTGIRIYCKQKNWFLENGSRSFYYGFRNIDVNYMSFKTEEARIRVRFDIPDPTKQFVSIDSVSPVFSKGSISDPVTCQSYKIYVGEQEYNLGDILPALTESVEVEIGLSLSNEISPLLSGLIVGYESA